MTQPQADAIRALSTHDLADLESAASALRELAKALATGTGKRSRVDTLRRAIGNAPDPQAANRILTLAAASAGYLPSEKGNRLESRISDMEYLSEMKAAIGTHILAARRKAKENQP